MSAESKELSDEQSDDDYLFESNSDKYFLHLDELDANDASSKTSFAASLNSVVCDKVTAKASNFGSLSKLAETICWEPGTLTTGRLDQKFCNATHVADEIHICTTECPVYTLVNWTSSGRIDWQLVSE